MNGDVIPAAVAAVGGGALAGSILLHERRRREELRRSRSTYELTFPMGADVQAARAALASLVGVDAAAELVFEVRARAGRITHRVHVPKSLAPAVQAGLQSALPGLRVAATAEPETRTDRRALRVFVPTGAPLRDGSTEETSRAMLALLALLRDGEAAELRWAIGARSPRPLSARDEESVGRGWQTKTALPGFAVAGLVLVDTASAERSELLLRQVATILRARQAGGHQLRLTPEPRRRRSDALPRLTSASGWLSTNELAGLLAWPLGDDLIPGVTVGAARELPVRDGVPSTGRRLFVGSDTSGDRIVAMNVAAALRHLLFLGPTGSGKSELMARIVLDDLVNGYGGVLLDLKGDLVPTIANHVPPELADRVVILDPAAPGPVPGLDVFGDGGDPDLRADVIVGMLSTIFARWWGPRSDLYGRLGIRTLATVPGATLADLGRLFVESGYRAAAVRRLDDPVLRGAWQSYEALSEAQQAEHVVAPVSRVVQLLSRPAVRRVLAQNDPKLDIGQIFAERKLLLVPLSSGVLGEAATNLLAATLSYATWAAIEARAALPQEERHPVFFTIDELSAVATLPMKVEHLSDRARGLGAGITLGLQALSRVPEEMRSAVLANFGSVVTFRASASEAPRIAREIPGLAAGDVAALGQFEVAARLSLGRGSAVTSATGRTEPLGPSTGQLARIREQSARDYGGKLADPHAREQDDQEHDDAPIGRTRRQP
jgi:Type IV secretion-system coupling protein DNA-binding domain